MRKTRLLTATAMGIVLLGAAAAGQAFADTSVSSATTAPLVTSTAGNVTIASGGSITLTSGTAITVDSDNTVTLNGPITMSSSAGGSTGILVTGGHTSGLSIAANINVTDSYTATDSVNGDGVADGPFSDNAQRYGIHSTGASSFVGDVNVTSASTIGVKGDNSYGIRFENNIQGNVTYAGSTTVVGNNVTALSLEKGVTGNVYLGGSASVVGQNATAVNLSGDYGGTVVIAGNITGTGYATATPTNYTADQQAAILATPSDMYQAGPLVSISGNIAHGLLLEAIPSTVSTSTSIDQDGDGFTDSIETTASLTQSGSAPALRIGSATSDITLGGLVYNSSAVTTPSVNYGLLVRGSIHAGGIYPGITSTAMQLGGMGHNVTIANGIGTNGTVASTAVNADTTAVILGSGLSTPRLDVNAAGINGSITTTTVNRATALDIQSGASLPQINIAAGAGIYATSNGSVGNATAIHDASNTLTAINNNNVIKAAINASDDNADGVADPIVNSAIAIDARTNTVGLTINQIDTAPTDDTISPPSITGDIYLGSGNDIINLTGGSIAGNIDFGGGANAFTITGNSIYAGSLTGTGSVALDISAGTAILGSATKINLSTFHLGSTGVLSLQLNTATPSTPLLAASGNAVFDNGAVLGLSLNKLLLSPTNFTVMTASNISLGDLSLGDLGGDTPFVYAVDLTPNAAHTVLSANFRLKTQAESGMSNNEMAALVPVLTAASQDAGATTAILSETTKAGFSKVFNAYLPDFSGENLLTMARSSETVNRSLSALTQIPDNTAGQYWLQENGYHMKRAYGDTNGFSATGFAFAAGREQAIGGRQMLGTYLSFNTATPLDSFAIGKENQVASDLTVGGYWRLRDEGFKAWAHAGAGFTNFRSTRELLNISVSHTATANWSGYSYSGGLGASYDYRVGPLAVTPQLLTDYYHLSESAHTEKGGGDDFDLTVAKRDGHLLNGQALLNVSYTKWFVRPEIWVGYKDNISVTIPNTVANFVGGTPFTLNGGNVKGGGGVAGFRISADNQWSFFSLDGEYEKLSNYTDWSVSLRTRFQF
ncbi:MAG: autotransporter domain-containing protein [Asticcacaulis sp.]